MSHQYANVDYWDERYNEDKDPFEWYQRYYGFRHFLTPEYLCPSNVRCRAENALTPDKMNPSVERESSSTTEKILGKPSKNDSGKPKSQFPASKDCRVLILGCGNSEVGEEMLSDGFTNIICNVDFSSVVIRQMNAKYSDEWYQYLNTSLCCERKLEGENDGINEQNGEGLSTPKWILAKRSCIGLDSGREIADVRADVNTPRLHSNRSNSNTNNGSKRPTKLMMKKMVFQCIDVTKPFPYPDQAYDLILCKGTFDAILCAQNRLEKIRIMMSECHRVLDENHGVMLIVSYGDPDKRLCCFDRGKWKEIKTYTLPKPSVPATVSNAGAGGDHYVYILYK
mmetsp:Transcript_16172/g.33979  ORF Transcript_16172/g.33979 Transcript_16172/m.33979 type:complete len:339 (+) Transcript_16172:547-1563(+)|eukprot:CAMPEP_0171334992 /NCGR_PEP_ID=MMETSP0878-20121228/5052_1 /TAXON_ID=67004 /ORGANISM="Thalassiosira weissflogii, Strain CCMP1336" /LENGTH=338 /DNA_ID=CAMNT_0011836201 /DNA_START=436 /DNA_END=1452 /DNA_ORIENTATION=-